MSRHTFNTAHDGRPVTVAAGWDRPLQGFFMTIEYTDKKFGDFAFNNLNAKTPNPPKFGIFRDVLSAMEITIPHEMLNDIIEDGYVNMGNKVRNWDLVRSKCARCGSKTIERQYTVWRREDIDDDRYAFATDNAEATNMGSDWWCRVCDEHPSIQEYHVATEAGMVVQLS